MGKLKYKTIDGCINTFRKKDDPFGSENARFLPSRKQSDGRPHKRAQKNLDREVACPSTVGKHIVRLKRQSQNL